MKKYGVILMLAIMIFVIGCGNGEASSISVEGNSEVGVADESVSGGVTQEDNNIKLPDIDYEEWLVDMEGNKLFGYNLPLGWTSEKGDAGKGHVSVALYEYASEQQVGDITIHCSAGNDWMMWYETENAPEYMQDSGVIYELEKTIDTVYGKCKFFYGRTDEENRGESIYCLVKLNDEWCLCFVGYAGYYGLDVAGKFMEDYIHIITSEKQTLIQDDYEYPHYLLDDTGNKLMGFNTPVGMNRVENADDPAVCMKNGSKTVRILNTDCEYAYYMMSGGDEDWEYVLKGEVETVYGIAKIYDMKVSSSYAEFYYETALFCVNGVYIWVQYSDYDVEGYTNQLEDIISNQLFIQK